MIKITTKQLLESWVVLQLLSAMELPPKVGYQVGHATTLAAPLVENYQKFRAETLKKFSRKDDEGEPILIPEVKAQPAKGDQPAVAAKPAEYDLEDRDAAFKAIEDIQTVPVELAVHPISLESLGDTKIPAFWFGVLNWLIVDQASQ